jgi:Protein of unknown function (DUF2806)
MARKKPATQLTTGADEPRTDSGTLGDLEAGAITALSTWLGFPVPPTVAKSIFSAVTALVGATVAVPVAWLEAAAAAVEERRALSEARAKFYASAGQAAAKRLGTDEQLADRAAHFFGERMFREQEARESIAREALEDLKAAPPAEDAVRQIDADWLDMFSRHAETKTNQEMRTYFARVLAAEIRKPGSFLPETLEVLAKLSGQVALMFQRLCGLVTKVDGYDPAVLLEPLPIGHGNELAAFGIPIEHIWRMGDAGLLRVNFQNLTIMAPSAMCSARVGGRLLSFRPLRVAPGAPDSPEVRQAKAEMNGAQSMRSFRLTAAGCELWEIAHATPNEDYMAKFLEWTHNGLLLWPATR